MEVVFSYSLQNAWGIGISTICIYDSGKVVCTYENSRLIYKISDNIVNQIYGIINRFPELMQDYGAFDISYPYVLDGFINVFVFNNGKKCNTIMAFNLDCFKDNDSVKNKTADILLLVFDEIAELLIKNGVDKKYISL